MDRFTKIQQRIAELQPVFETEKAELGNALNRILQEDVFADISMPPFDKSAMDGYACRIEDINNELQVLEVIQAGEVPAHEIGKNQCSKIMTGAMVPTGADCVFKVEDSETVEKGVVRCTDPNTHKNICYKGEDYKKGSLLIKKGTVIKESQIAVLAGAGYVRVQVSKLPRIALIATGSELVEPHVKPTGGQIRNSNASQLTAQLQKMGLPVSNLGIAGDDFEKLSQKFNDALEKFDVVFFTGGASVGDFDWIPEILKDQDFEIYWDRTGIKPGNPMTFSRKGNKFCFGLSGNPVSSLVQFELIARPVLYRLLGGSFEPLRLPSRLTSDFKRAKADRLGIVPVKLNNLGEVEKIPFHGSAHINALVNANALLEFPVGETQLNKGEMAYVRPF